MKKTQKMFYSLICLFAAMMIVLSGCDMFGGPVFREPEDEKTIPVYHGMVMSTSADIEIPSNFYEDDSVEETTTVSEEKDKPGIGKPEKDKANEGKGKENGNTDNNGNHNGWYKDDNGDGKLEASTEQQLCYVSKNQDVYFYVCIANPAQRQILSITLNGKVYTSDMFEERSTSEVKILKYNVGDASGIVGYTIDEIKYVYDQETKTAILKGERTVKAGIKTEGQVTATVTKVDVADKSVSFDITISDTYGLIAHSNGSAKIVLYKGGKQTEEKALVVGSNTVTLSKNKNSAYEYEIVAFYDDLSGAEAGSHTLLSKRALQACHVFSEWVVSRPATCTVDGVEVCICSICGIEGETRAIPAPGRHTVPEEGNCEEKVTCTVCGEKLIPFPHNIVDGKCTVCEYKEITTNETLNITATGGALAEDKLSISWATETFNIVVYKDAALTDFRTIDTDHFRCYAGTKFTLVGTTDKIISKLIFTCTTDGNSTDGNMYVERLFTSVTQAGYSATINGDVVIVFVDKTFVEFSLTAQSRFTRIDIICDDSAPHEHAWVEATCTAPKTCIICGATEGAMIDHVWNDATCTAPKTCIICGATEGATIDHTVNDATATCSVCGKSFLLTVEEAIAIGMTYEKGKYGSEYYYVILTLDHTVNPTTGFARTTIIENELYVTVAAGYLNSEAEGTIKLGDTVLFKAKLGAVNSLLTTGGKELRLYEVAAYTIVSGVECETHSYEVDYVNNPARFNNTWGICTVCGYIDANHEHSIKDGKCVYCGYEFEVFAVPSTFDNDGDGKNEIYYFSHALPERFNNAIRIDAVKAVDPDGSYRVSDFLSIGEWPPYPHIYCYDKSDDALVYTITVEKAGTYELAAHLRIKDNKVRGAKYIINEGTANEQMFCTTHGWETTDEAFVVRNNDCLAGTYMTGMFVELQEGVNTITIRVVEGVDKDQHFRDFYLLKVDDIPGGETPECEEHSYEVDLLNNPARFNNTWGICTVCGYIDANHEHSIKDGKCVYCGYEFEVFAVPSEFDNNGDGKNEIYYFSHALPERFMGEDVIWIDTFKDADPNSPHMEYDEVRAGYQDRYDYFQPYPHVYCYDKSDEMLVYTINVDKAGIYELAAHLRIKDEKLRGATYIINKGTDNEQVFCTTFGWNTRDEAYAVRNNDRLMGTYMSGMFVELQEGVNTITIRVAEGVDKNQHFRDFYLVKVDDIPGGETPECEEHSYEVDLLNNPARFNNTWGICTICGYIDDNHEHSIKDGKCIYCDYEFETFEVPSVFDNDGDGNNDVYYFSHALPERFMSEDVIWIEAFKDAQNTKHQRYDEYQLMISGGHNSGPYPHVYCFDESDDEIVYTITVGKAGIYELAAHVRIRDNKTRGAKYIINEGTANEQIFRTTFGWATTDEIYEVRNNAFLLGSYMTGMFVELQAGVNTITIRVAEGVKKDQHFRDLYLVWTADLPGSECETHSYEVDYVNNPARFNNTWGICTVCGYIDENHEHSVKDGKCIYCDYEFDTFEVPSTFDNDGDGNNEVYYFSYALPERFNNAIRIDAFNDADLSSSHQRYDEVQRYGEIVENCMPYPHVYCMDYSDDALVYTITVEKAGIYELAAHLRIKDYRTRGAKYIINEGTANEQVFRTTYGWNTQDEACEVRNNDRLLGSYMAGMFVELQEGVNTITIRVAEGVDKDQHFRDFYLVLVDPEGCETHNYGNRFEKKWGICLDCGYIDENHEHSIKDGKCVYCDYIFETIEISSIFDNDKDGNKDVYYFSAALPERFTGEDVIWVDAFNDIDPNCSHTNYDEYRLPDTYNRLPYPHAYCSDQSNQELIYTITVEKAGVYELAVHQRIKDCRQRGATYTINKGTANEQVFSTSYGWSTDEEAFEVRNNDFLIGTYMTGMFVELQEGVNTIHITCVQDVIKSQHFRDFYLVKADDLPAIEPTYETLTAEEAIALGITFEKSVSGRYYITEEFYYVTLTLNTQVNADTNGFARATLEGVDMVISVAPPVGYVEGTYQLNDTVTFLAQVGCVNSISTSTAKEARLFNATIVEVVKAPVEENTEA